MNWNVLRTQEITLVSQQNKYLITYFLAFLLFLALFSNTYIQIFIPKNELECGNDMRKTLVSQREQFAYFALLLTLFKKVQICHIWLTK